MTVITSAQVPSTALPASDGSLEQLTAYCLAAMRFHTLAMGRIQLVDSQGAISSYRPCTVNPVETPDNKMMLFGQVVLPLVADPFNTENGAVWQQIEPYSSSAILTAGYSA